MPVKYRTQKYATGPLIEAIEAISETEKTVTVPARWGKGTTRSPKHSEYLQYHDTWEAAHAFLLEKAEVSLSAARRALQSAQDYHGNVKGLRKP